MTRDELLDHTALGFGKYRDKTPDEISMVDPSYICWLYREVKPTRCSATLARACKAEVDGQRDNAPKEDDDREVWFD